MDKARKRRLDSVGWIFYAVTTAILVGPFIYYSWGAVLEDSNPLYPIGMGLVIAMFVAAVITWLTNSLLQFVDKRRPTETAKSPRKKKH